MRAVFWALLAINLVFFAVMQWGGALTEDSRESLELEAINPQKIKLVTGVTAASAAAPASSPAASSVAAPVAAKPVATPSPVVAAARPPAPAAPHVCLEWGDFSGDELVRASKSLAGMVSAEHLARRPVEHLEGYWVYVPPLHNQALTNRVAQLKASGITDYFVVQDGGKWQGAISLGMFKTKTMAQTQLSQLKAGKGVADATVGEYMSRIEFVRFALKDLDAATAGKVGALPKQFAGSDVKTVQCKAAAKR
ncbi:MAG: SPOR domain-containing protein [Nitrosomonadales bacterium]|nr:SPOR domain-containing protein [Nitrosomonadales bacterium]